MEDTEGIMIERVPDTPSHTFVQAFIKSKFSAKWKVCSTTKQKKGGRDKKKKITLFSRNQYYHVDEKGEKDLPTNKQKKKF